MLMLPLYMHLIFSYQTQYNNIFILYYTLQVVCSPLPIFFFWNFLLQSLKAIIFVDFDVLDICYTSFIFDYTRYVSKPKPD